YCMSNSYLIIFIYCYGNHRDLHSFPTRRSSDLIGILNPHLSLDTVRLAFNVAQDPVGKFRMLAYQLQVHDDHAVASIRNLPTGSDRKSTRLNSSHDQISYAVFCLKKKNTDRDDD